MKTKLAIRSGAISLAAFLLLPASYAQNVGIGVSNPQSKLTVNGTTASGGGIVATGDIVTVSNIRAVTSFTPSDIRLKNIVGRSDAATDLDTLEKIEITDYTMKDTVDDLRIVDYDAISMLNVSATQELAKKGDGLEKKVAALEAENDQSPSRSPRHPNRSFGKRES